MRFVHVGWVLGLLVSSGCGASPESSASREEPSSQAPATESTVPSVAPSTASDSSTKSTASPTSESSDKAAPAEASDALTLDKLAFKVPSSWVRKEASSTFVLAEFTLPKPEGAEADGRLTVSVAGGSVEANVSRWRDQFGGKPDKASEESKKIGGLEVTMVDFTGEFNDQRGPFAPASKRGGYRMLAAVIPVDGELHFVKATGPEATIAAYAESFHQFIDSAKKK